MFAKMLVIDSDYIDLKYNEEGLEKFHMDANVQ